MHASATSIRCESDKQHGGIAVVIDDDPLMRWILTQGVLKLGLEACCFASGEEALAWIERNGCPSLVSVDVGLPHMSGYRVCDWLRSGSTTSGVPIVIVTARCDLQDEAIALELGAAYVAKPFKLQDYVDVARSILERSVVEPYASV